MSFIVLLAATAVLAWILRKPLKAHPVPFYAAAGLLDIFYIVGASYGMPRWLTGVLVDLVQKCELALALFAVVMFIGCFGASTKVSRSLRPIRAELSILAWILTLGHMAVYLASYGPRIFGRASLDANVLAAFGLALVLFLLLAVLGVTSFSAVKRRMAADRWKRLQRLAYVFFGLVFCHLVLMLAPAALRGGAAALESLTAHAAVFGAYLIARVARAVRDRRCAEAAAPSDARGSSISTRPPWRRANERAHPGGCALTRGEGAVHFREHGEGPHEAHLRQARHPQT